MKKLILITVLAFFIQSNVTAQSCLPDGITFSTQTEIDNFQTTHPNCTEIEGNVTISGDNITNLNGLSVLTSISGDLFIGYNASLTSLNGLEALTYTAGNLQISGNTSLTNLVALENLTSIGGDFHIGGESELGDGNPSLTSLIGLDNVVYIDGDLIIAENNALTSLTGLENLNSIEGSLLIGIWGFGGWNQDGNDALISLTGLDNITSVGGDILILANPALTSLTGLDNVTSIEGKLSIKFNNAITSLTGLDNIDAYSITEISINENASLSTCEVKSICDYLVDPSGIVEIYDNAPGCNGQVEVEEACDALSLNETHLSDQISIYPNPSTNQITIELPNAPQKNALLAIYDINYQLVITHHISEQKTVVDISGLSNGFYYVKVTDNKMMIVGKMVKN